MLYVEWACAILSYSSLFLKFNRAAVSKTASMMSKTMTSCVTLSMLTPIIMSFRIAEI